jgi:hypothetical protein
LLTVSTKLQSSLFQACNLFLVDTFVDAFVAPNPVNKNRGVVDLVFVSFAGQNCPFAFGRDPPFSRQRFSELFAFELLERA